MSSINQKAMLITSVMKFYRQNPTPFILSVWENAMRSYDFEQMSKAVDLHFANPESGQYMPRPADIIKAMAGTVTDRAAMAWGKAYEAMQSVGAYTDVVFDDHVIHAVIADMGGWPKICRGETKDISYQMHQFCNSYKAYAGREKIEYQRQLIGDRSADSEYEKKGLKPPTPKFIGNPEKCQQVLLGGQAGGKTMITDSRDHFEKLLAILP